VKNKPRHSRTKAQANNRYGLYFLGFIVILYCSLFLLHPERTCSSFKLSWGIFVSIIPVLFIVVFFMGLLNYFLKSKAIKKHLGKESGIRGWLLAIFAGILSHGPIYVWYPLLRDLRSRGMKAGLVATFLYNRAIKIPLLPIMIFYFGVEFVVVLMVYMIAASVVQGKVIDMVEKHLQI